MKFKKTIFLSILILVSATKVFSQTLTEAKKNYDPEIDQNNLMLVDATLELNEAMLAGIKASIDTLSKPDPEIKDKNNVKEILQRMKRARDRNELLPYLQYMNDSLSLDCNKLKTQKEDILSRLTPFLEHQHLKDSLSTAKQNPPVLAQASSPNKSKASKKNDKKPIQETATVITKDTIGIKKTDLTANAKNDLKLKEVKSTTRFDTVMIFDLGKSPEMKPAKEKGHKQSEVVPKLDTIQKPVRDLITQKQITEHKDIERAAVDSAFVVKQKQALQQKQAAKNMADSIALAKVNAKKTTKTSAVVVDSSIIAKKQIDKNKTIEPVKKADTIPVVKHTELKKAEPVHPLTKRDSLANKLLSDMQQPVTKLDTVKKTEAKNTTIKKDTIPVLPKATATKPVAQKNPSTDNVSAADTIQHIKSQFLLRRAQKAISEHKFNQAEEYLNKAIELWANNYDAWMTLADQDAAAGSQAKALKEYQECVRIDSSHPKLFYSIAAVYLQGKKKTEAVQYFTKTLALDTTYILAYMGRASIYSDWKKYDEAINDYDNVLGINRSYHYAYKARGMVKQLNRMFSEAVDDFTRYLIFEETDASAYYYRGLAKIGNKELLEGCIDLSKSAEMGYDAAEKAIKKSCE